ncbi:hypothetical protein [Luteibacter sp. CQ10]|uniref:dermonecrotic toxin domain-containing protein n=1 Tax=Luteibacter sp. CQ10 TaxID=2805821 RepID=UPI0034A1AAAD
MDMLPPQAPPALVSHANQAAVDTLQRLAATQAWIATQRDALPEFPDIASEVGDFVAQMDAYWSAPIEYLSEGAIFSRRQVFAWRLANLAYDDASLRHNDGTLSDDAFDLVQSVARHPGGPLPSHLHADELRIDDTPYAGAIVLHDDRHPDRVLMFTTRTGWESFASLDELYREVEPRLRERFAADGYLPGVGARPFEAALDRHFLATAPMTGMPFEVLADGIVSRLSERARDAWHGVPETAEWFRDALRRALDLHELVDVHAMVERRDTELEARVASERIASLPRDVAGHWREMLDRYRGSLLHAAVDAAEHPSSEALSLPAFTHAELTRRLRARGIDADPADIHVRVSGLPTSSSDLLASAGALPADTLSLVQLAFRNLAPTELVTVLHPDGSPRDDVTPAAVRELVTGLDLPNAYAAHLDHALTDASDAGRRQRSLALDLLRARMRFEAADARLAYYRPDEPRGFLDDYEEQGFQWAQALLDHPDATGRPRTSRGHELVAHQLTYRGAPLADVLLIGVRDPRSVSRVVLYTPNAPDGIAWREFADRAELTRRVLVDPAFEPYLLQRLPDEFAVADDRGQRHFALPRLNGNRSASWVFDLDDCADCTALDERFAEQEVTASVLDTLYDTAVGLAKRNAHHLARSTRLASVDGVLRGLDLAAAPFNDGGRLAAHLIHGVVQSVPRTAQAAWRFYDHAKAGDPTAAFLDLVDGYTSALNVVPLYAQVPSMLAGSLVRASPGSGRLLTQRRPLPRPDTLFEDRFLAHGVTLPSGPVPANGVYAIGQARYIRHGDKVFQVRFDTASRGWRLTRPGALDAHVSGPAIERRPDGLWHFRHTGLRGGSGRGPTRTELDLMADAMPTSSDPSFSGLTRMQFDALWTELSNRLGAAEAFDVLRHMVSRLPGETIALRSTQLHAWREGLRIARLPPAPPPPVQAPAPPQLQTTRPGRWPQYVYHYLSPERLARMQSGDDIVLAQQALFPDAIGVPALTMGPDTPLNLLPESLRALFPPATAAPGRTLGEAAGAWVRINLEHIRTTPHAGGIHRVRVYHLANAEIGGGYVIRPVSTVNHRIGRSSYLPPGPLPLQGPSFQVGRARPAHP